MGLYMKQESIFVRKKKKASFLMYVEDTVWTSV